MTMNEEPEGPTELDLTTAAGVWAIRTSSPTVYFLDLDRREVFRARGAGSGVGAGDNTWCRLVSVERLPDRTADAVAVGFRHRYVLDPGPAWFDYQWWVQRVVTAIEHVSPDEAPPRAHHNPGPTQ